MSRKSMVGEVVSTKMTKTVVVSVPTSKKHKKYEKRYISNQKYKAHNELEDIKLGDKVVIQEDRPRSKDKKFIVVNKVETK